MVKKEGKSDFFRSFTVAGSSIGFEEGKYVSKTPGSAAKKIARKLHSLIEKDSKYARYKGEKTVQFIMRETTMGSDHKTFAYDAEKSKLAEPITRTFPNGKDYVITHAYKAKALFPHEVHSSLQHKM
jgi:hypothetical protein